jgi:hypothetical protein
LIDGVLANTEVNAAAASSAYVFPPLIYHEKCIDAYLDCRFESATSTAAQNTASATGPVGPSQSGNVATALRASISGAQVMGVLVAGVSMLVGGFML